ncbi:MAG TPA: V-type ATP synthase subunit D [bacterium]|nr:V-type ATP synthase subunit D [bacterium]
MARYRVVPTKTNLSRLKRDLGFADEGYSLLEQKRQILVVELMGLIDKTADAQEKVESELAEAFEALKKAVMAMGRQGLSELAPAVNLNAEIEIGFRRIMGVNIPKVEINVKDNPPYFSLGETSIWVDETISRFRGILVDLGSLAELRISLMRLSQEVQKTVRRVNALEKIAIPDYRESIKYIEDTLEEIERDTFATLKLVKERLEKRKG